MSADWRMAGDVERVGEEMRMDRFHDRDEIAADHWEETAGELDPEELADYTRARADRARRALARRDA